jgi:hypothetical protein
MRTSMRLVAVLTVVPLAVLGAPPADGSGPAAGSSPNSEPLSAGYHAYEVEDSWQPPALRYQYTFGDFQDSVGPAAPGGSVGQAWER